MKVYLANWIFLGEDIPEQEGFTAEPNVRDVSRKCSQLWLGRLRDACEQEALERTVIEEETRMKWEEIESETDAMQIWWGHDDNGLVVAHLIIKEMNT